MSAVAVREGTPQVARATAQAAGPAVRGLGRGLSAAADIVNPDLTGVLSPRLAHTQRLVGRFGEVMQRVGQTAPEYPGAPFPAAPSPELIQAAPLAQGGAAPPPNASAGLGNIPVRGEPVPVPTPEGTQPTIVRPYDRAAMPVHGESALGDILTHADQQTLLRIAKSRGISVTQEAQLKAGVANPRLIRKIVDDFGPDELEEISAKYLDAQRSRHQYGPGLSDEAWNSLTLGYYFPQIKIPATMMRRSQASIQANMAPTAGDLTGILQESVAKAKSRLARR